MTKEEILAMEAGNQLNAEVASQIMDIKVEYPFGEGFPYYLKEDDKWRKGVPWAEQGEMKWAPILPYSTDISAAWLVVDKMFELGHAMSLLHLSSEFYPEYWYCDFRLKDSNEPPKYEWIDHQTAAPVAICKAALLAKLGGEK